MVFRRQLVEVFERGDATRCLLDFVEDDERVCRRYGLAAQELYLGDDAFGVKASVEQRTCARFEHKVKADDVLILLACEFVKKPGFSRLAGPLKQEGLAVCPPNDHGSIRPFRSFHRKMWE